MRSVHGTPEQLNSETSKYKLLTLTQTVSDKPVTTVIQYELNTQDVFPKENHTAKLMQKVRKRGDNKQQGTDTSLAATL